jgi:nucleoside-diphosphate-sugar epimerase
MVLALHNVCDPVDANLGFSPNEAIESLYFMINPKQKIVLTGAAGLVGQNLAELLLEREQLQLVGIDKHHHNAGILQDLHPEMTVIEANLAQDGEWAESLKDATALVMLQAQIGGENYEDFVANNITSTEKILDACRQHGVNYIVHISSSVVNSKAEDFYTETKLAQEKLVLKSGIPCVVLRPTLMFGWFDRKHLGWLSRFMRSAPVFPIPGSGRYMRQPLYIRDFCKIIHSCLQQRQQGIYDISGLEEVDYIDIIRSIRNAIGSKTPIVRIPFRLFWLLLKMYAVIDRDPPFTTKQLEALVIPDKFLVIPWGEIFGVNATPFEQAIMETFTNPRFSKIKLQF